MKVLGLTGGIGMGKSTCAQLLRSRAVPVVDTDDLARQVVEPGQMAFEEVISSFGPQVVGSDGTLSRKHLARIVFADPVARRTLEGILHPRIRMLWRAQVDAWRAEGHAVAVVVIPLLFETNAQQELDATLCVACSAATQRQRLLERGWPLKQIEQRIQAQFSIDEKIAKADYVIWTEGSLEVHSAQVGKILSRFQRSPCPGPVGT